MLDLSENLFPRPRLFPLGSTRSRVLDQGGFALDQRLTDGG